MPCLPMFIILLDGFDALNMIYLELKQTDVIFSRITMVLFLCRKWIARNFFIIFSRGNKQYWSKEPPEGSHLWATSQQGAATALLLVVPWWSVGPTWLRLSCFQRQKILYIHKPSEIKGELPLRCCNYLYQQRTHLESFQAEVVMRREYFTLGAKGMEQ